MRILITAGPTREYFDTVRFLSNPSSGKMGYALARAAVRRGHDVVLVSGPVALRPPRGARLIRVTTAAEMAAAGKQAFTRVDAAIMTAAVCDYRPAARVMHKLKKASRPLHVRLEPTEDIAASLGRRKGRRLLIGFAMEDHHHRRFAAEKLARKRCDAIVLNGPGNIGADRAEVEILVAGHDWIGPWRGSKLSIATRIIRLTEQLGSETSGKRSAETRRRTPRCRATGRPPHDRRS